MTNPTHRVTYRYYLSTLYRNASRNRPVRVSFDSGGVPIAVERIHPLTGELEVMDVSLDKWGTENVPYEKEIDQTHFETLRERMLAPPTDEISYEYFLYASTLVRIIVDSQGNRRGAEYVDRKTGKFVLDHTYMSKITFDWNAEAEEIDQVDFEHLHAQIKQAAKA